MITENHIKGGLLGAIFILFVLTIYYSIPKGKSWSYEYLQNHGQIETMGKVFVYYPKKEFIDKQELKAIEALATDSTMVFIQYK